MGSEMCIRDRRIDAPLPHMLGELVLAPGQGRVASCLVGKALFDLFRGGVFADGGLLSYSRQIKCLPVKVYPEVYGESSKVTIHSYEGVVYKYSILVRDKE